MTTTTADKRATIQLLERHVSAAIAAGQVVGVPADCVDELVQNALDAQASEIKVHVVSGGIDFISVQDNGHGIPEDQLTLAFKKHSTSKIRSLEDLQSHIGTYGFRGEALASIAEVSRCMLSSSTGAGAQAFTITFDALGEPVVKPSAKDHDGTYVEVRDLFYNIRARRRFLGSPRGEFMKVKQVVRKLALVNPNVSFVLTHNEQQSKVLHCPAISPEYSEAQRINTLMVDQFSEHAVKIDERQDEFALRGYLGIPTFTRRRADCQFLFVNGRPVQDKAIAQVVRKAYGDMLFHGMQSVYVLFIEVANHLVDVNIHPSKREVKFSQSAELFKWVMRVCGQCLSRHQLAPQKLMVQPLNVPSVPQSAPLSAAMQPSILSSMQPATEYQQRVHTPISPQGAPPRGAPPQGVPLRPVLNIDAVELVEPQMVTESIAHQAVSGPEVDISSDREDQPLDLGMALGLMNHAYIVAQNSQGMVMVDIHAAHERILYERLKTTYAENSVSKQALLLPVVLTVDEVQQETLAEHQGLMEQMGFMFRCEGDQLTITHIPALFARHQSIEVLVTDVLQEMHSWHQECALTEHIHALFSSMACHRAFRHHDDISLPEMNQLLRDMESTLRSAQCNHGRPTWVQFGFEQIDKWFYRGQ